MPIVYMQITKSSAFQGQSEEWSNVYTLDSGVVDFGDDWSGIANIIADAEKAIHATDVTWNRYTVWNVGAPIDSVIVDAGDLSGVGSVTTSLIYKELALLVEWPLSRSPVLKRRRFLRKWLHTCAAPPGSESTSELGSVPFNAAAKTFVKTNYIDVISSPMGADATVLTDVQGERPIGDGYLKNYLEHRQFHRGT